MKKLILILPALTLLTGCVTATPGEQAKLQQDANRPVNCTTASDCEVKWGWALQWVLNNSKYKIQTQSDVMISTMGPLPDDPSPAFTITKTAQGNGIYVFDFRAGCDNIFGCIPSLIESQTSFNNAVMANAGASVALGQRGRFGVHFAALDAKTIAALHMSVDHGLMVGMVDDNSPASRAGIERADVIVNFAGQQMVSTSDLQNALSSVAPSSVVAVHIWRGGNELDLNVQF